MNEDGVEKKGTIRNNKGRLMQEHELGKGNKNGRKKLIREIKYRWDWVEDMGSEIVGKIVK